ncbi:hypothetical protein [Avibacterium paragallinarum]
MKISVFLTPLFFVRKITTMQRTMAIIMTTTIITITMNGAG